MHTNQVGYVALYSCISIAGILYLLLWCYPSLIVDHYRQCIFEARDKLFDEASQGLIAFNHPAYTMLRSTMNGYIRFGHRYNWWSVMARFLFFRNSSPPFFDQMWEERTSDLSQEAKDRLLFYRSEMHKVAARHLLLSTPELMPLLFCFLAVFGLIFLVLAAHSRLKNTMQSCVQKYVRDVFVRRTDDDAFRLGTL